MAVAECSSINIVLLPIQYCFNINVRRVQEHEQN